MVFIHIKIKYKGEFMDKRLYLVAELDNNFQNKFNELYQIILENGIIGVQTNDIPYHITLCSFQIDDENIVLNLMDKIKEQFNKINIAFSGFGLFGLNVLYLNPCFNKYLMELYNFANRKSLDKNNEFSAHATLLIDSPENILKILPKINEKFNEFNKGKYNAFTGQIENIGVYEFSPLKFIKKIELNN